MPTFTWMLAWLTMVGSISAHTAEERLFRCPVCENQFRDVIDSSGTQTGMRLDFKPIGRIGVPWRLAECPKCRFILFKGGGKLVIGNQVIESDSKSEPNYTLEETQKLKELIASEAYAKLPNETPSYQRLALIHQCLKHPFNEVGYTWLQASWQVEENVQLCESFLVQSAKIYDLFFENANNDGQDFDFAMMIRGELYRRLGQFNEAESWFKAKACQASEHRFCQGLIAQQLSWIATKDSKPHDFVRPNRDKQP